MVWGGVGLFAWPERAAAAVVWWASQLETLETRTAKTSNKDAT
jgi:hypothetical protein